MRNPLIVAVLSIIYLQCSESRKQKTNDVKTVDDVYSKQCLPKRTDRLVYRYQNDTHIFVGFDDLKNRKLLTMYWKMKEKSKGETLENSEMNTYHGQKTLQFRKTISAVDILAATNLRHQRNFIRYVKECQQSVLTMNCLILALAKGAQKMKTSPCTVK